MRYIDRAYHHVELAETAAHAADQQEAPERSDQYANRAMAHAQVASLYIELHHIGEPGEEVTPDST